MKGKLDHLAIIMDGNGRWALQRGLRRSEGHKAGAETAVRIAEHASERGIRFLTLYCFSTENWKRPIEEVAFLMGLFTSGFRENLKLISDKGFRILHLGRRQGLSENVLNALDEAVSATAMNTGMTIQFALNYGGEDEIERAISRASEAGEKTLSCSTLMRYLDNPEVPPPDFIVRSGGEKRLSGFLLLQSSYAEIGFYDKLWPDWDENMIDTIISDFQKRDRRFGGLV